MFLFALFIMKCETVLCTIVFVSAVRALKLNHLRSPTVWGVQKKLFQQQVEEYFSSWDGAYQFKFDTGNAQHHVFRNEKRFSDGTVVGFFGYIDPEGTLRITEYMAGRYGYKQRTVLRYPILFENQYSF